MAKKVQQLTPEMREYFRRLGSQGGKRKAAGMTADDRRKLGQRLAKARRDAATRRKNTK